MESAWVCRFEAQEATVIGKARAATVVRIVVKTAVAREAAVMLATVAKTMLVEAVARLGLFACEQVVVVASFCKLLKVAILSKLVMAAILNFSGSK